ncbi:MAG: ATP-binding protein [Bacteroidota bacterium]
MTTQSLKIESKTERLIDVRDFVSTAARESGFGDEEVSKIALAIDEACTNIIKHAYNFDPAKEITVTVKRDKASFEVLISDHGKGFNPGNVPAPDMKEYLSHFRRGGLGVYLMRSLMDKVEYSIVPGRNEVRLVKYIPH